MPLKKILIQNKIILYTFLAAISLTLLTTVLQSHLILTAISLFLITFLCTYFSHKQSDYFIAYYIINLIFLINLTSTNHLKTKLIILSILFIITTIIINTYIFVSHHYQQTLSKRGVRKLAQTLFACLVEEEYQDNIYRYERKIHQQRIMCNKFLTEQQTIFTELYANLLSIGQLRIREKDLSTLSLCSIEMKNIAINADMILAEKHIDKLATHLKAIKLSISELEDTYQSVIQIAAKYPHIYLLLIDSLKSFHENLTRLTSI